MNLLQKFNRVIRLYKVTNVWFTIKYLININNNVYKYKSINNYLECKFADLIRKYKKKTKYDLKKIPEEDYKIWVFWWQGIDNMPEIVHICLKQLNICADKYNIIVIDKKNFDKYVDIPNYILDKLITNKITITSFSDVLRSYLLNKYGGLWIDATCYLNKDISAYDINKKRLYTQKFFQEKNYQCEFNYSPSFARWASFFMGTDVIHYPLFSFMVEFWEEYFKENSYSIHYLLLDFIIDIAYNNLSIVKSDIDGIPINNVKIYDLEDKLMDRNERGKKYYNNTTDEFVSKLSWKENININILKNVSDKN